MKNKTIAELKKIKPVFIDERTGLTKKVSTLIFNKKIKDFDAEDIAVLISQSMYLDICIPMALEILREDPMIEDNYYPGDLLTFVLSVPLSFWQENLRLKEEIESIFISNKDFILQFDVIDEIKYDIIKLFE